MSTAFHLVFAFYLHVIIIFLILWHRIGSINVSIRCQCIGFVSHERSSKSPQVIGFSARPYPHIGKTIIPDLTISQCGNNLPPSFYTKNPVDFPGGVACSFSSKLQFKTTCTTFSPLSPCAELPFRQILKSKMASSAAGSSGDSRLPFFSLKVRS